jgi:hypothetical protein
MVTIGLEIVIIQDEEMAPSMAISSLNAIISYFKSSLMFKEFVPHMESFEPNYQGET